jgi:DNA polymerase
MATVARPPRATIDFESRSAVNLKKTGTWRYSVDPSTEVLCLAYRLPHWEPGRTALWYPAFPHLGIEASNEPELPELFQWVRAGELVEAHNAFFERSIWLNIMVPRHGFPKIAPGQWRDSAVKAAAHALPRSLADVTSALRIPVRKDMEGHKLMLKLSKPRKLRKAELAAWVSQHGTRKKPPVAYYEHRDWFERLWQYCRQDVLAEEAVSERLPDCTEQENGLYILDQIINERGFCLDRTGVDSALKLLAAETARLNGELLALTDGAVERATQRTRLVEWFKTVGLTLYDTQKQTLDDLMTQDDVPFDDETPPWVTKLTPEAKRGVTILRTLGRSSTAKYEAMRNWIAPDSRVHGGLLFHGASTGRWSGMGVQPHNFPKGTIKHFDMDMCWEIIKSGCNAEDVAAEYGSVTEPLSCALRGAITASPGKLLYVADYASIEARGCSGWRRTRRTWASSAGRKTRTASWRRTSTPVSSPRQTRTNGNWGKQRCWAAAIRWVPASSWQPRPVTALQLTKNSPKTS